jgi:hypothetical protein
MCSQTCTHTECKIMVRVLWKLKIFENCRLLKYIKVICERNVYFNTVSSLVQNGCKRSFLVYWIAIPFQNMVMDGMLPFQVMDTCGNLKCSNPN